MGVSIWARSSAGACVWRMHQLTAHTRHLCEIDRSEQLLPAPVRLAPAETPLPGGPVGVLMCNTYLRLAGGYRECCCTKPFGFLCSDPGAAQWQWQQWGLHAERGGSACIRGRELVNNC